MTSSPLRPGISAEEALDYYKKQYEQLEADLADFQASSKELEEQLERDIETAEKSERKLKEQVEALKFEVEEWKTKHAKAKAEANSAQDGLQREITALRDTSRSLQLRLRDIEVANDDYERKARNTESSLEDLESKYNVAIERSVLLEEEVKHGEQEREGLRIEAQRLRDELGDLKVENEITLEKLRHADATIERLSSRKPSPLAVESLRPRTPASEASGVTPSSPAASTPPPKSDSASDAPTPPSPPLSDVPAQVKRDPKTPSRTKRRSLVPDASATPRPSFMSARTTATTTKHSRGPSVTSSSASQQSAVHARSRPSLGRPEGALPRSESLYQIRNLRGRMQKIEERVHSARSKLPAPQNRTPRGSPRSATPAGSDLLPPSVTMRRTSKRPSTSVASHCELASDGASDRAGATATGPTTNTTTTTTTTTATATATGPASSSCSTRRESHVKRLSYGIPRPASAMSDHNQRPPSALERPASGAGYARPSSRASRTSGIARPASRTSGIGVNALTNSTTATATGTATATATATAPPARPSSSLGGTLPRNHRVNKGSISDVFSAAPAPAPTTTTTKKATTQAGGGGGGRKESMGRSGTAFAVPATPSKSSRRRRSRASTGMTGEDESSSMMMPPPPPPPPRTATRAKSGVGDVGETY